MHPSRRKSDIRNKQSTEIKGDLTMLMEKERIQIVEYGREMSAARLCNGTAGNISILDKETGYMAISPSGVDYMDTRPEDVVVVDLNGNVIEGDCKPSSEMGMHAAFYKAKADEGCLSIVHTHSMYATTLACMGEPLRAVHYVIASSGVDTVPLCPYTTFGTPELARLAVETCNKGRAVLLANHGLVALGINIKKAFGLAANLEYLAQLQFQCLAAGKINVLSSEQIDKVLERFRTYGQTKAATGSINTY